MTTWILILYFVVNNGGGVATEKFNSLQSCQEVGNASKEFAERQFGWQTVNFTCLEIRD